MAGEFDNALPDGKKHVNAIAIRNDSFFIVIQKGTGNREQGTGNR